jgi:hypothetical protein
MHVQRGNVLCIGPGDVGAFGVDEEVAADESRGKAQRKLLADFLVSPDPSKDEVNTAWGVDVVSTTALTAGTGVLIDSTKFGVGLVREGMVIRTGSSNDDFVRNLVRYVFEERITLAVERPTAILKISGLPTSIGGS